MNNWDDGDNDGQNDHSKYSHIKCPDQKNSVVCMETVWNISKVPKMGSFHENFPKYRLINNFRRILMNSDLISEQYSKNMN